MIRNKQMKFIKIVLNYRCLKFNSFVRFKHDIQVDESTLVSSTHIKKKLKTWDLPYDDGYTCFITNCVLCSPASKKASKKLFINKVSGLYLCTCMKYSGNWDKFEKYFDSKKNAKSSKQISALKEALANDTSQYNSKWEEISKRSKTFNEISDDEFSEIIKYFNFPIHRKTTFETIEARIDETKKILYFPFTNTNSEVIGYKSLKLKSGEETTYPETDCHGILITKSTKSSSAILVNRIVDLVNLSQYKLNIDIICLPYGIKNLPQQILPLFENYEKLIIWFGHDVISVEAAKQFAKKLEEKRCFIVRSNDKCDLPSLVTSTGDLKKIMSSVTPVWHKSITTFGALRQDILFDLKNIERVQGVKWTRYPTLNRILKGHRRGELTVLTGPTGSGKTTFISEYSLDLAMQGVNTLWGSFEIRNARLARTMLQQMVGLPLEEHLDQFDVWADKFEQLPIYFMTFHGQQSIKIVMEAVEHATYVHDISHVIIDNVQFMMGTGDDTKHMDRFWKQDVIVSAFRTFATKKNCHVTLVIHPRKERDADDLTINSIFGGAKASQEADNVLLIQDKRLSSIRGKKYLQVTKNRYSGDLGVIPLDFDKSGLSYCQKKKKSDDKGDVEKVGVKSDVNIDENPKKSNNKFFF